MVKIVALGLLIVLALTALSGCGQTAPPANAQVVTMDGSDPATGQTIDPINVFDRLPGGRRVGTVRHGARVTLIAREGEIAHIQTPDGIDGYVAADFIKELR